MPSLDLSEAFDPEIVDSFTVRRQAETLGLGRSVITTTDIPAVYGVVCAASPNDLEKIPDSTSAGRAISVVAPFHFKDAQSGFQPDLILWQGSAYLVAHVDLYPHFGEGFFQSIAISQTAVNPAV